MKLGGDAVRRVLAVAAATATITLTTAATSPTTAPVEQASEAIPGNYIVRLADDPVPSVATAAADLAARYGGEVGFTYESALRGFSVRDLTEHAAARLAADPTVAAVSQDGVARGTGVQENPPSWGLDRVDQEDLPLDARYTYENTAEDVAIYNLDSGIRPSHRDFADRIVMGPDFVADGQDGVDCHGHGTHTAGTSAGTTFGVAKGAALHSVRVLGCDNAAPDSVIIAGLDWVAAEASERPAVVNFSIYTDTKHVADKAVRGVIDSGVAFVVAAGNADIDACESGPAHLPEAITVGATDEHDRRAEFSNWGPCLDLFAPGVRIDSAGHEADDGVTTMQGTSMAAPHVTGAVALYLAEHPEAEQAEVEAALVERATEDTVQDAKPGSPDLFLNAHAMAH
ncbi:S8 family serine peptidase [Allosaccharopolyspora coralli]|uniref:S8 family serine peptidase n=1 Tax=Allosaccharopolyspora coralli TaxID=2665642 RepID=A0A5Q3Q572_9PSEU|nr:S8 family peptidase [Allosaccharopolyspora coralli]QGK69612.1 S8 family serine peptidase [Allosaccharopolyspora coralli]